MISKRVFHPFLFALYPLLLLIALNYYETTFQDIARLIFFVLLLSSILLLIFRVIVKDWYRAGLLTSITLIFLLYFDYSKFLSEEYSSNIARVVIIIFWILDLTQSIT